MPSWGLSKGDNWYRRMTRELLESAHLDDDDDDDDVDAAHTAADSDYDYLFSLHNWLEIILSYDIVSLAPS